MKYIKIVPVIIDALRTMRHDRQMVKVDQNGMVSVASSEGWKLEELLKSCGYLRLQVVTGCSR